MNYYQHDLVVQELLESRSRAEEVMGRALKGVRRDQYPYQPIGMGATDFGDRVIEVAQKYLG